MARGEQPPSGGSNPAPRRGRGKPSRRRLVVLGLLLLLVGGTAATMQDGKPLALTVLEGLVLIALVVVIGTYVILARTEPKKVAPEPEDTPPKQP